jgi:hypothetical protein
MSLHSPPAPLRRAPPDDVARLWARYLPLHEDGVTLARLRDRGVDAQLVEELDLARRAGPVSDVPHWAGHFLDAPAHVVLPLHDARGLLSGVIGRTFSGLCGPVRMRGVAYDGLVLASPLARQVLERGAWPDGLDESSRTLVVVHGERAFLERLAGQQGARPRSAVLGIPSGGSWSRELGDRIPSGSRVTLDLPEGLTKAVFHTIHSRCRVVRARRSSP